MKVGKIPDDFGKIDADAPLLPVVPETKNYEKHEGITFILFDMTTPGVTVKPIKLISGMSPFCETFLDDVRVPKANLVHEVNKGWTVGKRLLQYERSSIGGIGGGYRKPSDRPAEQVLEDVLDGYLSVDQAQKEFGVVVRDDGALDHVATGRLRAGA